MQHQIPQLENYGMSVEYGFLPPGGSLSRLSDPYYALWESTIADLPNHIRKKRIRTIVDKLPVLDTSKLTKEPERQRAYSLLSFIAQGYVWGDDPPAERLPPSISVPLLEVCAHLEILPVITYAALCLWNFQVEQDGVPENPDNLVTMNSFTGTMDESWFYLVPVAIEAQGAPIVVSLLDAIKQVQKGDFLGLTSSLNNVATRLGALVPLLHRVHEHISPQTFYHSIRPFFAGSQNLSRGIIYDTGTGVDEYHRNGGGSAAQSTLFQLCDIALGVQHGSPGDKAYDFVTDMRKYMPSQHRSFLEDVEGVANIKEFVLEHSSNTALNTAYTSCLGLLKAFRNKHINVVTRYIVLPSKSFHKGETSEVKDKVVAPEERAGTGTGGAPLMPFLKTMRDTTA